MHVKLVSELSLLELERGGSRRQGRRVAASAPSLALIHPSAWKGNSAKFAKKVATTSLFGECGAFRGTCRIVSVIERGGADRHTP